MNLCKHITCNSRLYALLDGGRYWDEAEQRYVCPWCEAWDQACRDAKAARETIDNITDTQILTLLAEAAQAGDDEQVALCDRALEGDEAARIECARAIAAAEAMAD